MSACAYLSSVFFFFFLSELSVRISFPSPVTDGSEVKMICINNCTLEVMWRKNGKDVSVIKGNNSELILSNVTVADEGDYSCALRGFEEYPSNPVKLIVMCKHKLS